MLRRILVFPTLCTLALVGCGDSSPTSADELADEAAFELVAEASLEATNQNGPPLPSLDNLLRRTFRTIRSDPASHTEGIRLVKAGKLLEAIVAVLGPEVARYSLAGVHHALVGLADRLPENIPDRMKKILREAHGLFRRGKTAWENGRPVAALGAALASADLIRTLSPRFQARMAIDRANRALKAAREAVAGTDLTTEEETALKKAHRFRNGAVKAFKAKKYRKAWNYARESIGFSRWVLQQRSGTG
jgi:hypothetical protein